MKRFFSFCGLLLIFTLVISCGSSPAASRPGASAKSGSSVWIVGKNGKTMFLGGSIHVLRSEDFPLPKEFDRAFAQSSMLVLEADVEKVTDPNIAQYLMTRMFLPNGKTLETILDSKTYAMLKEKCEEFGIPVESVAGMKPSMVVTLLTMMEIESSGFAEQGVDMYCLEKAKRAEMRIGFLETVEAQIDMIVTMGDGYENDFVKYSLYDMDNTENDLDSIVSDWREGNAANTEITLAEMKEQWPVLYQNLLIDRNEAWLPLLEDYLAGGETVFVVVGLAHLHGRDGLLRRLKDSGCTVEQFR